MNRILGLLLLVSVIACESKKEESPIKEDAIEELDVAEKKIAERRANGDTLAMSNKELENFLPQSIGGYLMKGNPSGEFFNENGTSWSNCEKVYVKGNDSLRIALADYNGAYGMFAGAMAVFAGGASINNEEEMSETISIKDGKIKGWQSYKKNAKVAYLIAGIGDRFLLTIEANNQNNSGLVKTTAESMDLEKLMEF